MRIGFALLTLFPNRVGGSETYVRSLLAEFTAGNGPAEVIVLANRYVTEAYGERVGGPVRLHEMRSYRPGNRDLTRALAMAAARLAPRLAARDVPKGLDLLHLPVTVPIPDLPDVPTVTTIHEVQYHVLPHLFSPLERRYRRWAYDGSARAADRVIAVSGYVGDKLADVLDLDRECIEVAHLGIDHGVFRPDPGRDEDDLLRPLELPERFIYYPANLWPHKNHALLLQALRELSDTGLALILSGQDYGRLDELLGRARRLGVHARVRHIGHLDPGAVAAVLRRALALVYPSLHEGFGAPPLEAMACGCPVASSLNSSLAEVCGDAVEPLDPEQSEQMAVAIERVTGDDGLRARLRARGLERAARFTWEAAAARHQAIYERAAATSGGRERSSR